MKPETTCVESSSVNILLLEYDYSNLKELEPASFVFHRECSGGSCCFVKGAGCEADCITYDKEYYHMGLMRSRFA